MITPSVFISYRREDSGGHAGRLCDHLRTRFGGASVFMDVTDIEAGVDFVDVLQRAVGSCDVLLAVIGREWLTCTDRNGRRRLDDPHDFIRLEIGIALTRNVRVIPVLVEGAAVPTASELPSDLAGLTRRQAVELRDARWNADVESLAGVLDHVLGHDGQGTNRREPSTARVVVGGCGRDWRSAVAVVTLIPVTARRHLLPRLKCVQVHRPLRARPCANRTACFRTVRTRSRTNPAPAAEQPTPHAGANIAARAFDNEAATTP